LRLPLGRRFAAIFHLHLPGGIGAASGDTRLSRPHIHEGDVHRRANVTRGHIVASVDSARCGETIFDEVTG